MAARLLPVDQLPSRALPRECFVSEATFARERDLIFRRSWIYAAHSSQLRAAGEARHVEVGGESVLLTREADQSLHVRRAGDGAAWVDVWNGLVFVSLAQERPEPVRDQLRTFDLSAYQLERTRVVFEHEVTIAANWKVIWENGLECYHCAINHPELRQVVDVAADGMADDEFEPLPYEFTDDFPLLDQMRSVTGDGTLNSKRPLGAGPAPQPGVSFLQWHLSAFELIAAPDHAHVMTYRPVSPGVSVVQTVGFVHEEAVAGRDYDLDELFSLHQITRRQDDRLCELVQVGVSSPAYEPGPYNDYYEFPNRNFARIYFDALGIEPAAR